MAHGADRTPKAGLAVSASGSTPAQEGPVNLTSKARPGEGQGSDVEGVTGGGPEVEGPLKPYVPDAHSSHAILIEEIQKQAHAIRLAKTLIEKALPIISEISPSLRRELVHGLFELESCV